MFETCNYRYDVKTNMTIESGQYLNPTYECRMFFCAPENSILTIQCSVTFSPYYVKSSYHDSVRVNGNGNLDIDGADIFYGSCQLTKTSTFNNLWIAFLTYDSYVYYKCDVTAKPVGCECGWTMTPKISVGSAAPPNKYTSMSLVQNSGQTYCGGTISKLSLLFMHFD